MRLRGFSCWRCLVWWLGLGSVLLAWRPLAGQDLLVLFNEGVRLFQEGKSEEALALFRKVVEINPNDGEAWVYIGTILVSKQDYEGAISALEKGLAQSLSGLVAARGWVNLGVAYQLGRQDLTKALQAYERALSLQPDLPEAHHNILLLHLVQGNFADAVKVGERAFSVIGKPLKPEQVQATFERALELIPRDYERALELLRSMAQQQLPRPEFFALMGQAYEGIKQPLRAALFYGQAAALAPQIARYHRSFGWALAQMKRWSEAIKALEFAIALDNRDAFSFIALGLAYSEQGRWQEAVIVLRRAVELDPHNWDARVLLATAYERTKQLPQAMQEYLAALGIREDPSVLNDLARLHLLMGESAEQQGQWREAEEAYRQATLRLRRAVQLAPSLAPARLNLAIALRRWARVSLQQGQPKVAEELLQEAEKGLRDYLQQANDPAAKLELARLLSDRKAYDEALKLVREVLSAQPKSEEALLLLGFLALQLGRLEESEQAYAQALKLNPKNADAAVGMGVVAFYRNRYDEAENWFRRALDLNPNHLQAKQNLEIVRQAKERSK